VRVISSAKTAEALSVPTNERIRLHDRQQTTPLDESRQGDEHDSCRVIGPVRPYLPFQVQRQLLSQEQILRGELGA